jgi:hypothetical protein
MKAITGLRSGESIDSAAEYDPFGITDLAFPFTNKWQTCYRCKGLKDQLGNVSNATCSMCRPI